MSDDGLDGGLIGEPDEADFADRPLPPRVSRTSRMAIIGAVLAVIAMVAAGLVIGEAGGGSGSGSDTLRDESSATPESVVAASEVPASTDEVDPATAVSAATVPETTDPDTTTPTTAAPTTAAPTTAAPAPAAAQLAIADDCLDDLPVCTRLVSTSDGRIVAFSPPAATLTVLDETGQTIQKMFTLDGPVAGDRNWLVAVGPNDVAYLGVPAGDAQLDLYGVALAGPDQGSARLVAEGLDGSGDTDLVPTIDGLATVGCCGFDMVRPNVDATLIPWLDGAKAEAATFQITLGDGGNDLIRNGPTRGVTSWPLPAAATSLRGMPRVVPTDDGGALMWVYFQPTGTSHLIRFATDWPQYRIDNTDVFHLGDGFESADIRLLEPAGTVIVAENGALVRRTLDDVGSAGWTPNFDFDGWTVEAVGLNDHITEAQPSWAIDPEGLAFQLSPETGANEQFYAQFDPETNELTIQVSGFLDDSVFASAAVWPLTRSDDGLFRVGTGNRSQQCQPGRGQQDFQPQPCI